MNSRKLHSSERNESHHLNYSGRDTALRLSVHWINDTTVKIGIGPKNGLMEYITAVNRWSQFDAELIEAEDEMVPAMQYEYAAKDCGAMIKISLDSNYVLYDPYDIPGWDCGREQLYVRDSL